MLADDYEIKVARDRFLACVFLAGVDRERYRDTIDELNNNYMRRGKEYPQDVQSMMIWLMKRRGSSGKSKKEEDMADSVIVLPNSKRFQNDDSSVGSNGSSRSDGSGSSLASLGSGSSGSASQLAS